MSQTQATLPYASCYQQDNLRFHSSAYAEMQALLLQAGLQRDQMFAEPEDHLAIGLALLSHLSFASDALIAHTSSCLELRNKVLDWLWRWLPMFSAHCIEHDKFGFYAAQSQLLLAVLNHDRLHAVKP